MIPASSKNTKAVSKCAHGLRYWINILYYPNVEKHLRLSHIPIQQKQPILIVAHQS